MILCDGEILKYREQGLIVIEPFDVRQLGPNSYDCRLDEWHYLSLEGTEELFLDNPERLKAYWGLPHKAEHYIKIRPGGTALARTHEIIGTKAMAVATMHNRSSIRRSDISICMDAGFGDIGYVGRWTLEIANHTRRVIDIPVGKRVCQVAFWQASGGVIRHYQGKYGKQGVEDMLPHHEDEWEYHTS